MQEVQAKRRHIRFKCDVPAELTIEESARALTGTILDLSREGCLVFVEDAPTLAHSAKITVTFDLNRQRFELSGVVLSQRQGTRIGIRFISTTPKMGVQLATLNASETAGWGGRSRQEQEAALCAGNAEAGQEAASDPEPGVAAATGGQNGS